MATQIDQFERPVACAPQFGRYIALGESHDFAMRPSAVWAHTHLSTVCVYDDDDDFAYVTLTGYSYVDDEGRTQRVDTDKTGTNRWRLTNLISSWTMVSLTYQTQARSVGAMGLVIIEFWEG